MSDALQNSGPQSHDPFHGWKTSFGQYRYPHRDEIKLIGACKSVPSLLNPATACHSCYTGGPPQCLYLFIAQAPGRSIGLSTHPILARSALTIDILWSRLEFLHMVAVTKKPSNGSADIRLDMEY